MNLFSFFRKKKKESPLVEEKEIPPNESYIELKATDSMYQRATKIWRLLGFSPIDPYGANSRLILTALLYEYRELDRKKEFLGNGPEDVLAVEKEGKEVENDKEAK